MSSGNVFADLGLDDAEDLPHRSQIGFYVFKLLEERRLAEQEISSLLKISQSEVSHLLNGHYSLFTTDRLLDFLQRLDRKVTIQISPRHQGESFQEVLMVS